MAHYTTGLPKLDLEPFDPTPLYAAASSPRREKDFPRFRRRRNPLAVFGAVTSLLAAVGAAGAAVYYLL